MDTNITYGEELYFVLFACEVEEFKKGIFIGLRAMPRIHMIAAYLE
jgi:hypothetical protein